MAPGILTNGGYSTASSTPAKSVAANVYPHDSLRFDPRLKPKSYKIAGTPADSTILLLDVNILDSTGKPPYRGDVLIEGERFAAVGTVPNIATLREDPSVRTIHGRGRTLLSGLGDAHAHFTWNNNALELLGSIGVEEHALITARSARSYLDSGYTMCYGAASAKDRLDCVIRDAINAGEIPGPRLLANGREIGKRDAELAAGITAYADGPLEMREVIRRHAKVVGVDQIKLSMSGEAIMEGRDAEECFFTEEETAACVDEAHRLGVRVCAHARARESVVQCVEFGVDVVYHASYTDALGMDLLQKARHRVVVAPALNWLYATVHEAEPFGYTFEEAERVGYKRELEVAIRAMKEMHRRGITVLPGGDYGFAWCPHGTYARDLEHFVKLLDFTPMESIVAATAGVAKLFMQENELGKILPGYYADCILVNGDPLEDISVLQDHSKLDVIMINGRIHKAKPDEVATTLPQQLSLREKKTYFNYVAFEDELGRSHIGHLDLANETIQPLTMASGSPLRSLQEVVELADDVVRDTLAAPIPLSEVKLLPPLTDRDVLCVGNNYRQHVKEFRQSGFDTSGDAVDSVPLPTIFTKRSTSIIASGEEIYPHTKFTQTLDYEGEIGVIIGKPGFNISEKNAIDHVWGFTIINGRGPIAVPAAALQGNLRVQTFVNGDKRQDGSTADLIYSIPKLIEVISRGMTLQPGDIIATGTPHGVGVGHNPPLFLKPGDLVEVSVTGLGTLSNRIAASTSPNPTLDLVRKKSHLPSFNLDRTWSGVGLTKLGTNNWIHARDLPAKSPSPDDENILVFIHGLGANLEYYRPLIEASQLQETNRIILYDLDGHGLTPAHASKTTTLTTYAETLHDLLNAKNITPSTPITLIGWSLGGLIAMLFAQHHPSLVKNLVLLGPGPNPFPAPAVEIFTKRAALARSSGMSASRIADDVAGAATGPSATPLVISAVRQFLLGTHPEGYARGCIALARSINIGIEVEQLRMPVLIVAGSEDRISSVELARGYAGRIGGDVRVKVLQGVGHWHVLEDLGGTVDAIRGFLEEN
ncbi:fumarylacetoacetate hydrolase [Aspergillus ustus]|uniref:Fumarylacetoacetate hydrolase n=1 Tax=Aspergillus ustus TaxID=40382 RepID=A0A0C1E764_ASPUT|nr:fumarylacetoacetate hydrolase [Aspergillus ustus]